jgi:sulfoacetaldehyde dehydrogenase
MSQDNKDAAAYVKGLVDRARAAQEIAGSYTQDRVDELVLAIAWGMGGKDDVPNELAKMALEETRLGDDESKVIKMKSKARGLLHDLKKQKSVGVVEDNKETGLMRIVKPIGVIASLVPSTQPEMHPLVNAMNAVKARDAVIFAAHPSGKKTTFRTVEIMRQILKSNGAPEDLLICAENPSIALSTEIMRQCDLIIATGGSPMVKAAQSVGKPSYGVGAGNAIMVVDETADVKDTAQKIKSSKIFDLSAGCSCDNSVIIHESVYASLIKEFQAVGAYLATPEEKAKLQKALWPNWPADHVLNRDAVCKPVQTIAGIANISVPENTQFILVEEQGSGEKYPFSGEKMCLVLTIYKYKDFDQAIAILNENLAYSGSGHSCGIFSHNRDHIMKMALSVKATRMNINLPNSASNTGNWWNRMPVTSSLGCGSWGGNIISENLSLKHYLNNTWVISGITPVVPTDEELFGAIMGK